MRTRATLLVMAWMLTLLAAACATKFGNEGDTDTDADETDTGADGVTDPDAPDVESDGAPFCGNGEVEGEEECDDGADGDPDDGCTDDCTYSCHEDVDCRDGDVCDGDETCGGVTSEGRVCEPGMVLEDGYVVEDGDPRIICLDGASHESICGDDFVDTGAGEFCEPPSEGSCNDECQWGCEDDGDCPDDGNVCNGDEFCDTSAHLCDRTTPPAEGTECLTSPRSICLGGTCQESLCGDSYLDAVLEECDDGRTGGPDDGCTDACEYSCHVDGDCNDGEVCNGAETCGTVTTAGRVCEAGTNATSGTACNDGLFCTPTDTCDGAGSCTGTGVRCDDGLACTADTCDESADTCVVAIDSDHCVIGGACVYMDTPRTGEECQLCDPTRSQTAWSNLADGTPCSIDIYACTLDECRSGTCDHPIESGWCRIGGVCYSGGTINPSNECQECVPTTSQDAWTARTSAPCDDGDYCTTGDACTSSAVCVGTAATRLFDVAQISAGDEFTCALLRTGGVRCWGRNVYGQLGDGTTGGKNVPTPVTGLSSGVDQIDAGGDHTCVLASMGVKCWGYREYGRLGDGTGGASGTWATTPVDVVGLGAIVDQVCAGGFHSCALLVTGEVQCWGSNTYGQLGNGDMTGTWHDTPVYVLDVPGISNLRNVIQVDCGSGHTCALLTSREMVCWGANTWGQIGDESGAHQYRPVYVHRQPGDPTPLDLIDVIGLGSWIHSCALVGGYEKCWGRNHYGQLGDNSIVDKSAPVYVRTSSSSWLVNVVDTDCGGRHTCAYDTATDAWCWGRNEDGELGIGTSGSGFDTMMAVRVMDPTGSPLTGVSDITGGGLHTCAIVGSDDDAMCWGSNSDGQLGIGASGGVRTYPTYTRCGL